MPAALRRSPQVRACLGGICISITMCHQHSTETDRHCKQCLTAGTLWCQSYQHSLLSALLFGYGRTPARGICMAGAAVAHLATFLPYNFDVESYKRFLADSSHVVEAANEQAKSLLRAGREPLR